MKVKESKNEGGRDNERRSSWLYVGRGGKPRWACDLEKLRAWRGTRLLATTTPPPGTKTARRPLTKFRGRLVKADCPQAPNKMDRATGQGRGSASHHAGRCEKTGKRGSWSAKEGENGRRPSTSSGHQWQSGGGRRRRKGSVGNKQTRLEGGKAFGCTRR